MAAYYADMHHLPLNNRSMDGAMFLYSICHADNINVVLEEAHRVTKPGGKLFVFDYLRTQGDDYISWQTLHARFFGFNAMEHVCRAAGWRFSGCVAPEGSDEVFRSVFFDQKLYDRIFDDLTPVVWWAKRV
jgi:ubiquinone/menaquinone biosynthesis C-methylase UbiE